MSILHSFRGLFARSPRGRRTQRPVVESLEDRTVPSLFMVGTVADDGPGSLRQAVCDANANKGPDDIAFAQDLGDTITLTSGQLSILGDLTIHGPGADRLAVSGNDASRVFLIGPKVTVALADLTITHGRAEVNGGGIWNLGSLTLTRVVVSHNEVRGAPNMIGSGGGVFNDGDRLSIYSSTFQDNRAVGGAAAPNGQGRTGRGGGVYSGSGVVEITSSTFTGNEAIGSPGDRGGAGGGGRGGAVLNAADCPDVLLIVSHSMFTANRSLGGPGGEPVSWQE